jgi:hypothetical protein
VRGDSAGGLKVDHLGDREDLAALQGKDALDLGRADVSEGVGGEVHIEHGVSRVAPLIHHGEGGARAAQVKGQSTARGEDLLAEERCLLLAAGHAHRMHGAVACARGGVAPTAWAPLVAGSMVRQGLAVTSAEEVVEAEEDRLLELPRRQVIEIQARERT